MISVVFSVVHRFLRVSQRNSVTIRIDQVKPLHSIAFLLAFLPPEPTYSLIAADNPPPVNGTTDQNTPTKTTSVDLSTAQRYKILFSEKAEWQHSSNELIKLEPYYVQTSRHNRIACLYVNCTPNPKYYILFSHGNAVDLGKYSHISLQCIFFLFFSGQMASFFIVLGTRIQCNIFSYDYSGYGVSQGNASEKNMYSDIEATYNSIKQRFRIPESKIILYGQSIGT